MTGAPKQAACALLAGLEPVGRGPSMGALGLLWPGGLDLGLTIRTVALDGTGCTCGPVAGSPGRVTRRRRSPRPHAKAAPVLRALSFPQGPAVG